MVSGSSFDKSIKKALDKDSSSDHHSSDSVNTNTNKSSANARGLNGDRLPHNEKIQLLFPKCKPRNDYQYPTSTSKQDSSESTNLISIASSPSSQKKVIHSKFSTQANSF